MLNKDEQRELAYLARVDEIKPIEGKDRVECAVVGGWTIMVRKDQFKPGDIGIYFEIDSKVPATDTFEFLAAKHYKIKTQKYGKFLSQGLLMHPDDFGWEVNQNESVPFVTDDKGQTHMVDDDSRFVTKQLGVVYSVAEDNKRKSNGDTNNKYKRMSQRHHKLFKHQPFRWLMKRQWGKDLLFIFFGKKRDKRNWPEWVKKTDEERCLWKNTKVITDKGAIRIADIVNKQLKVKVLSYNIEDNKLEYKSIVDYQKFPIEPDLIKIKFPYKFGVARRNSLICTPDHKILTQNGWTQAKNIKVSDKVCLLTESVLEQRVLPVSIESVSVVNPKGSNYVYDIEVEDNHTFIASNIVNHNCENMTWILENKNPWIATEKIDGTSTTFTMKRNKFGKNDFYVCSRNVVFDKPDRQCYYDSNVYLEMADKYNIEAKMDRMLREHPEWEWVTIQGETYGKGIQKNDYGIDEHRMAIFNFITSDIGRWSTDKMTEFLVSEYDLSCVPIVKTNYILPDTIEELREYVHSEKSVVHYKKNQMREGIVFRDQEGIRSFKCVDPEYLVKIH